MKIQCKWNEKLKFSAEADGHRVEMDSKLPLGSDSALSPKQLLLAAVCGCTGMDVVALLKKYKQPLESFHLEAESTPSEGPHPIVFKNIDLKFKVKGPLDGAKVIEAVTLSQTKFCGVSAMVSKSVPISYTIELNEKVIASGKADFQH